MTVLNFPNNPSNGDQYNANGIVYTWNGSAWTASDANDLNDRFVQLDGDTMTGNLDVPSINDGHAGPENVIINGEMKVNQRATAVTGDLEFPVDRWRINKNDHGDYSGTQDADHPPGFGQSVQISCTTAKPALNNSSLFMIFQRIEGFNVQPFAKGFAEAKPFSVSFWFKTNKQGTYIVRLRDVVNSRSVSHAFEVTAGFEWVQYSHTFPADTAGDWPSSTTNALEFQLWLCAGSDYTTGPLQTTWAPASGVNLAAGQVNFFDSTNNRAFLTGVQLTPSPAPIAFQHEDYSTILSKCQRYYGTFDGSFLGFVYITSGASTSGRIAECGFPVTMRTIPTVTASRVNWSTESTAISIDRAKFEGSADNIAQTTYVTDVEADAEL